MRCGNKISWCREIKYGDNLLERNMNCAESFPLGVFSRLSINSGSANDTRRNLTYDYLRANNCQRELYTASAPFDDIAKILTRVILHR